MRYDALKTAPKVVFHGGIGPSNTSQIFLMVLQNITKMLWNFHFQVLPLKEPVSRALFKRLRRTIIWVPRRYPPCTKDLKGPLMFTNRPIGIP